MENLTVQIGIHDGRLILENSAEIDEIVILELQKFAKENALSLASQIDNTEDVMFDYSECEELEKELEFIALNTKSNSIKIASESILALTKICIQKKKQKNKTLCCWKLKKPATNSGFKKLRNMCKIQVLLSQ